jgi:hypothetical protein
MQKSENCKEDHSSEWTEKYAQKVDLSLDGLASVNCSIWAKIAAAKKRASVSALVTWAVRLMQPAGRV